MDGHQALLKRLKQAVREGADLLEVVRSEQAHILSCPICQQNFARYEEDYYIELLQNQEEAGQLERAARPQNFDLSFLGPARLDIWSEDRQLLNNRILAFAEGFVAKILTKPLKVIIDSAANPELSGLFSPFSTGLSPARSDPPGPILGQRITLPDISYNFQVDLILIPLESGGSHLRVEIREDHRPAGKTQVRLNSAGGSQLNYARQGVIEFDNLKPAPYTLIIRPETGKNAGHTWQINLTIEPALQKGPE